MIQKPIKFFTTTDNNNINQINFDPKLLFDSSKNKYLLKCIYCNYITDKTFNFEKHKNICIKKIKTTIPNISPFLKSVI